MVHENAILHNLPSNTDGKEPRRREKGKEDNLHASSSQSSSYFEIPTKEGHMANNGIHEIPTKDTEGNIAHTSTGKIYIPVILRVGGGGCSLANSFCNFKIYKRFYLDALYNQKVQLFQMKSFTSAPQLKVTPPSL